MKYHYLNFIRFMLLIAVVALPSFVLAQERNVTGTVTEGATGSAIPGVNILIKGTTRGTVSDIDGRFTIAVPDDAVLVFSSVGYVSEEIPVGNRSTVNVSLSQDIQSLSEVVVVGYGTQERARVTSAISSVSSREITELPIASIDQALQGRAAGVTVTNVGSPGTAPHVRIRGLGSLGNNEPLYVIDGMPAGGLNNINPNDIESMEILKDAAAAAIYGSRASNGVVLVTTKKGTRGRTSVNVDAYSGVQTAWRQLDLLNREQYLQYGTRLTEGTTNGIPARFATVNTDFPGVDTDWQDEMFRTAPIMDYNVSVNGGGENNIFNITGGYFKQEGIMLGTGFERTSFRANSEFKLGRVRIGETLTLAYSKRQNEPYSGGRSQIQHMLKMVPYIPVRDPNRLGGFRGTDQIDGSDPENPVLNAYLRQNHDENMKLLGTAYAVVEIAKGLEFRSTVGLDMNFGFNDQFTPMFRPSENYHINDRTRISQNRTDFISPMLSNQLSYTNTFGEHTISAVGVLERQTSRFRSTQGAGENLITSDTRGLDGSTSPVVRGNIAEYAILSYVGRINYDYAGRYLLGVSGRRDGSSRFASDHKWGNFYSVTGGWRISEEGFMQDVAFVSDLKLRGSWGMVGNDRIGDYQFQALIDAAHLYNFDGVVVPGSTTRNLANRELKWETTYMTNIGLDLGLMNDRIRLSAEYFNNKTDDLLLPVPLQPSMGIDVSPNANVGSVVNRGWELTAGYNKRSGDFQWSLNGNISFVRNEVLSLGTASAIPGANFQENGNVTTNTTVGQPIGYFFGWIADGIFQSDAEVEQVNSQARQITGNDEIFYQQAETSPGDIRFRDINGDGIVNDADRVKLGHYLPDFSYGFNATANYRGFDLSLFIQGVQGNQILNLNRYHTEGMTRLFNSGPAVLNAWTPENPNTDIPRAVNGDPNRNARISSRFIEDGSYLRIKNLAIGYTLPATALNAIGNGFIQNIRVYVSSQNLLTFTKYTGFDPEIGTRPDLINNTGVGNISTSATLNSGVDYGQFPQARTFIGGIQIGF